MTFFRPLGPRLPTSSWIASLAILLGYVFSCQAATPMVAPHGGYHTVALKSDGSLWSWGWNNSGQIGDGSGLDSTIPKQIGSGFSAVAAGSFHTLALKADGSLWTWGSNYYGQLGNGNTNNGLSPQKIGDQFSAIAAGNGHSLALKTDGSLWAWGGNNRGQLGDGTTNNVTTPKWIGNGFSAIAAGYDHSVAVKTDGSLWAWGWNGSGQLGDGSSLDSTIPKQVGTGFSAITAGSYHTLGLKTDSSLWAWGSNYYGQLGSAVPGNSLTPQKIGDQFSAVSAGNGHTLALRKDGSAWVWGQNKYGQLGDNSLNDAQTPKQIGQGFTAINAGATHSVALKSDGSLWAWGGNSQGQLGDGSLSTQLLPKRIINSGFSSQSAVSPQTGWWWNPDQPGRGYFIEVTKGRVFAACFLYENTGRPLWYVTGPVDYSVNNFSGDLWKYQGGQTLTGAYRSPSGPLSEGAFSVTFSDSSHANLTWPGGSFPITRFEIIPGSLQASAPSFQPQTGWWWNEEEGGRGFSVEVQGDNIYIAGFMYDTSGKPVWYSTGGKMSTPNFYQGTWIEYGNGQTMTGTWKAANATNSNLGPALFGFDTPTTGLLQLPDGRLVKLVRYLFSSPAPVPETTPEIRDTEFGKVAGMHDSPHGAYAWLGIPYAAPPLGDLRWKAPASPVPWSTTRQTQQFGNACPQIGSTLGPPPSGQPFGAAMSQTFGKPVGDEDCLTLNIWSPTSGEAKLPVLVFLYGGSNIVGWSGTPDYAGAKLAGEQKIIFVSLNYRLNLFGYLNHSALKTGDPAGDSGNFATLDIIQALKFIKNNISQFGGDPNNVTIVGQSAGAQNVWSLIVSPKAAGLFHKAIPISAGQAGASTASGNFFALNLLRQLVIDDGLAANSAAADAYITANLATDSAKKSYLYAKSTTALLNAYSKPVVSSSFAKVFYDGVVQPPNATAAFTGSFLNNVPLLAGATNEEGKYWGTTYFSTGLSNEQLWSYRWNFNPDAPATTPVSVGDLINTQYLPANRAFLSCSNSGYNALTLNTAYASTPCSNGYFNTSYFWAWQTSTLSRIAPLQPKTFAYNFAWSRQPEPWKTVYGAAHVADVPFLFGNFTPGLFSAGYSTTNQAGRDALSLKMRQSLAAFLRTGDPNHPALGITWQPWSNAPGGPKRLVFDANETTPSLFMSMENTPVPVP